MYYRSIINDKRISSSYYVMKNEPPRSPSFFKGCSNRILFTLSMLKWIDQVVKENWRKKHMTSPTYHILLASSLSLSLSFLHSHTHITLSHLHSLEQTHWNTHAHTNTTLTNRVIHGHSLEHTIYTLHSLFHPFSHVPETWRMGFQLWELWH